MAAVLNTNMASLYAQKNLSTAQTSLAESVQRLSSGTRINSAKDDAAGYGISQSITGTKNVVDQNIRNAQNGISWAQTAEGALDVVGKILQRALTLTTQARDASLNTAQLAAIGTELNALGSEINNIAVRTKFQGGTSQASVFGSTALNTSGNPVNASGTVTRSSSLAVDTGSGSNTSITAAMVDLTATSGFTSIAKGIEGFRLGNPVFGTATIANNASSGTLTLAVAATVALSVGDKLYINGADSGYSVATAVAIGDTSVAISAAANQALSITNTDRLNFYNTPRVSTAAEVTTIQNLINTNSTNRSNLGEKINALEYAVDNMQTLSNNLSDGISRIVDTDYAKETANLTRTQILQQAATAMLTQANQMPNVILTLLK